MPTMKPPILQTAVLAWRDAFRAIAAMPTVAGFAFAILLLISLISAWIIPDPYALAKSHWLPVFSLVSSVVSSLLLAPLAIVVHRYVLLGEVTNRYPLDPFRARYLRFVGFAMLLKLLWSLPTVAQGYAANVQDAPGIAGLLGFGSTVLLIVIVIVTVRRAILFPAIAIDAPGATWSNARRDTKGSSWRVAFTFAMVVAPAVIVFGPAYYFFMTPGFTRSDQIIFSLLQPVITVPTLCAFAAAASHIYRARADSLARPVGTVSSERSSPPRRRRYGWWIAGGIFAVVLALPLGTAVYFAKPIKTVYDFVHAMMTGNPSFEGCETTVVRETADGPLWYRIVKVDCREEQSYFVYTKRSPAARYWLSLMTTASPVPRSVRQTEDGHFEVVLEEPLEDGRASLPIDPDAGITGIQFFDHGRATNH